jgi:hypothetical protein
MTMTIFFFCCGLDVVGSGLSGKILQSLLQRLLAPSCLASRNAHRKDDK